MNPYVVWIEKFESGWNRHDCKDLQEVFLVIRNAEGQDYLVTKPVEVSLVESVTVFSRNPAFPTTRPGADF